MKLFLKITGGIVVLAIVLFIILAAIGSHRRHAAISDDRYTQIAKGGFWIALSHLASASGPVDACIAAIPNIGFFVVMNKAGDPEVQVSDRYWSLPPNAAGSVKIAVNGNNYDLPFSGETSNATTASLSPIQFLTLMGDLQGSSSMNISAGSSPAMGMDLTGGGPVLKAFLSCVTSLTATNAGPANQ